jgi:hypothetical protein
VSHTKPLISHVFTCYVTYSNNTVNSIYVLFESVLTVDNDVISCKIRGHQKYNKFVEQFDNHYYHVINNNISKNYIVVLYFIILTE